MDAPTWMDAEFFETLLRENEDGVDVAVTSLEACLAVGNGDVYVSVLHRVTIQADCKPEQRHLIIKSLSESEIIVKFALEAGIFEKEKHMYLETLLKIR